MLIEKENYKRNKKTGNMVKRQVVSIKCDECGDEWDSLYSNRKRKKLDKDLCKSCRSKYNYINQESLAKRRWSGEDVKKLVVCSFCKSKIYKYPSMINDGNNFCDIRCRDKFHLKQYNHLYDSFNDNINEVSYLFGLILGDGYLRKLDQIRTTRVDISFNGKEKNMISLAQKIMDKLRITYYPYEDNSCNCVHLGFVLPDDLLKKYDMFWEGNKYDANPYPAYNIIMNINMAIGLINSDGCCIVRKSLIKYIRFSNTVESIFKSFINCLNSNNIPYIERLCNGTYDNRTDKKNKDFYVAGLNKDSVYKISNIASFQLKGG